MMLLDIQSFLTSLLTGLGGAVVAIIALSKWLMDKMSQRALDAYNNKHERELEEIRTLLGKSSQQFGKYSDEQFEQYKRIWKLVNLLRETAAELWDKATAKKLRLFTSILESTKRVLNENQPFIERKHFDDLTAIIKQFEQYQFGKSKLIEFREEGNPNDVDVEEYTRQLILNNGHLKIELDAAASALGNEMGSRLSGESIMRK